MNLEKFLKLSYFIFPFLFVLLALRYYLLGNGVALFSELFYSENFNIILQSHLHAWDNAVSLGHSNLVYPEALGDRHIYGGIAPLSIIPLLTFLTFLQLLSGELMQKIYFVLVLLLPFFGMYPLAKYWFIDKKNASLAIFLSIMFYGINGTITARIIQGTLNLNIVFALFPLVLYSYLRLIDTLQNKKWKKLNLVYYIFIGGICLSFIIQLRIHYLILFGFFVLLHFFFNLFLAVRTSKFKNIRYKINKLFSTTTFSFLSICIIAILLNIHQWLPLVFFWEDTLENKSSFSDLINLTLGSEYTSIGNSIALISSLVLHGEYTKSVPFTLLTNILLYIPFLLSIIAVAVIRKRKEIFLGILMIISTFFATGSHHSYFGEIFKWIYLNAFVLTPFRDPTRFLTLTAIAYSLLAGGLLQKVINNKKKLKILAFASIIIYLILANPIYFSGDFAGNVKNLQIPKSYYEFQKWVKGKSDKQYRVFLLPSKTSIFQYKWYPKDISIAVSPNLFQGVIPIKLPLANTGWNNSFYSMRYYHFIESQINNALPIELWKINAKYIVTDTAFEDGKIYQDKISQLPDIKKVKKFDNLTVYENNLLSSDDTQILYYPKFAYLVGNMNIATISGKIPLISLYQNNEKIKEDATIFFYNSTVTDITASSLFRHYSINPNNEVKKSKGATKNNWVAGITDMQPFDNGIDILSTTPITTYTKADINLQFKKNENDDVYILLRPGFKIGHGTISIFLDKKKLGTLNLDSKNYTGFIWLNVGKVSLNKGNHTLTIVNHENKVVNIDAIIIAPHKIYQKTYRQFEKNSQKSGIQLCTKSYSDFVSNLRKDDLCNSNGYKKTLADGQINSFLKQEERKYNYSIVTYKSENPSSYKINLDKNMQEGLLVFHQTYSPYWLLGNQKPLVSNFFANGYIITDKNLLNNEVLLTYEPEQIYRIGIVIAIILYSFSIIFIVYIKLRTIITTLFAF